MGNTGKHLSVTIVSLALALFLVACGRNRPDQSAENEGQSQPAAQQNQPPAEPETRAARPANQERQERAENRRLAPQPRTDEPLPKNVAPRAAAVHTEIPAGAELEIRTDEPLDTERNKPGDNFTATLVRPLVVDGRTVIPQGTRFTGEITTAEASGRLSGQATMTLRLDSFEMNGRTYKIDSTTVSRISGSHAKRDIGIIGGAAGLGAAVGAIAGGGKGAAIGAGAGAAAGTAGAAATGKQQVRIPAETVMVFTLQQPVRI